MPHVGRTHDGFPVQTAGIFDIRFLRDSTVAEGAYRYTTILFGAFSNTTTHLLSRGSPPSVLTTYIYDIFVLSLTALPYLLSSQSLPTSHPRPISVTTTHGHDGFLTTTVAKDDAKNSCHVPFIAASAVAFYCNTCYAVSAVVIPLLHSPTPFHPPVAATQSP